MNHHIEDKVFILSLGNSRQNMLFTDLFHKLHVTILCVRGPKLIFTLTYSNRFNISVLCITVQYFSKIVNTMFPVLILWE